MTWKSLFLLFPLASFAFTPFASAHRVTPPRPSVPPMMAAAEGLVVDRNGTTIPPYNTTYYFDQLIDHSNPGLGTFKQRYWHTWEFYEPGGPIIIFTPGEVNAQFATGYLTNASINGLIAQQENGATIVFEHRFYGLSNPKPNLSVDSLRLHTIQQAIDDFEYFAKHVKLPMPGGDDVTPNKTPWVLTGGSYAGALTSWTMVDKPGLFAAGYASSATVEAISDYWEYFDIIRQFMPQNCSADVQAVVAHFDQVFTSGDTNAINSLKASFGMANLTHLDDVVSSLRYNLFDWQQLYPSTGPNAQFFQFCDALEVKGGVNAPPSGWGVDHALQAWATYFSKTYLSIICGDEDVVDCLGTYDADSDTYTDISVDNSDRSYLWFICTEFGGFQESAPLGHPSLVSRMLKPIYNERQCALMFPEAFPKPPQVDVGKINTQYKGWNVNVDHLFFANGKRDPWRGATVSADGLHVQSTPSQPIVVGDGFHCSDLDTSERIDPIVKAVQDQALAFMKTWLADFHHTKASRRSGVISEVESSLRRRWSRSVGSLGA